MTKGRVAQIQIFSNFSRVKNWEKIRKFRILAAVASSQDALTKTLVIDKHVYHKPISY